jgi:hypothetical protein
MKRFGETKKWDDAWWQMLSPDAKLFMGYLRDQCNHAGIWQCNFALADHQLGFTKAGRPPKWKTWFDEFNSFPPGEDPFEDDLADFQIPQVKRIGTDKWWLCKFVTFHHTFEINVDSRFFKSIPPILRANGVWDEWKAMFEGILTLTEPDPNDSKDTDTDHPSSEDALIQFCKTTHPNLPENNIKMFFAKMEELGSWKNWKKKLVTWAKGAEINSNGGGRGGVDRRARMKAIENEIDKMKLKTHRPPGKNIDVITPEALEEIKRLRETLAELNKEIADGN